MGVICLYSLSGSIWVSLSNSPLRRVDCEGWCVMRGRPLSFRCIDGGAAIISCLGVEGLIVTWAVLLGSPSCKEGVGGVSFHCSYCFLLIYPFWTQGRLGVGLHWKRGFLTRLQAYVFFIVEWCFFGLEVEGSLITFDWTLRSTLAWLSLFVEGDITLAPFDEVLTKSGILELLPQLLGLHQVAVQFLHYLNISIKITKSNWFP